MKKLLSALLLLLAFACLTTAGAAVMEELTFTRTDAAPAVDGKLDGCYRKIHDFYGSDPTSWIDSADPGHKVRGETWAAWNEDALYVFIKAEEEAYKPGNKAGETPGSTASCMYLALLATEPVLCLSRQPKMKRWDTETPISAPTERGCLSSI